MCAFAISKLHFHVTSRLIFFITWCYGLVFNDNDNQRLAFGHYDNPGPIPTVNKLFQRNLLPYQTDIETTKERGDFREVLVAEEHLIEENRKKISRNFLLVVSGNSNLDTSSFLFEEERHVILLAIVQKICRAVSFTKSRTNKSLENCA